MGALSTDTPNMFSPIPNFGDGTTLFGDRAYVASGVQGPGMCEGGLFMQPDNIFVSYSLRSSFSNQYYYAHAFSTFVFRLQPLLTLSLLLSLLFQVAVPIILSVPW